MTKRKRDVPVLFWVSAEELELIHQKMQQYGTENLSAYLRKMALDGYVVKLELPELTKTKPEHPACALPWLSLRLPFFRGGRLMGGQFLFELIPY